MRAQPGGEHVRAAPDAFTRAAGDERIVLAGIDEAGLGPLLGSLAIGYSVLILPAATQDPWKALRPVVAQSPGAKARLVVADSKVVFKRNPKGARRLENTVLAFRAMRDGGFIASDPQDFLFDRLPPATPWRMLPWGAYLAPLPCHCSRESLELSAAVLTRALKRAGIAVVDAGVRLVPASELNASYAETSNKAHTVWVKVLEVLRHLWPRRALGRLHTTIDMLGGRRRYGSLLARAFPDAAVELVGESRGSSRYALAARDGSGHMALEFRVQGDRHSFPVALASCFAKYARELEMNAFNAYFAGFQPELVPTAGYRTDGARWLSQAVPALQRAGLARALVVRER